MLLCGGEDSLIPLRCITATGFVFIWEVCMQRLVKEAEQISRQLPDDIQQEKLEVSILGEPALSDWNNDEEDDAWTDFQPE